MISNDPLRNQNEFVKIQFHLEQEDGWPPASVEFLWAFRTVDGYYQIDNIPFFAHDVSLGDVVSATPEEGGIFVFDRVIVPSGNSTIQVLLFDETVFDSLRQALIETGCECESNQKAGVSLSVSVPPHLDINQVWDYLDRGLDRRLWDYEDASFRHRL